MKWYCDKCKIVHEENEFCPAIAVQMKKDPQLLHQAADFISVAGQYGLVTSQALDKAAKAVNQVAGTDLAFEGTQQFARDIQVFRRLNEEPFKRVGYFRTPETAKNYIAEQGKLHLEQNNPYMYLDRKLTGYAQEVDWLREQKGKISSFWQKSQLLDGNAAGVDGETINRFNGETIQRTTIKASVNPLNKNHTNIADVKEAIEKGYATPGDMIYGVEGTRQAAREAGLSNRVVEKNSIEDVRKSNERLRQKMEAGQAVTSVKPDQVMQKMAQGAVIGAAIGLTISGIQQYIRYRNGMITRKEAFLQISEDGVRSVLSGGAMAGITIFLPGGIVGVLGGMAIGMYFNKVCVNVLDEIYGKGAYGAILNSSGYVYGMTCNLESAVQKIAQNSRRIQEGRKEVLDLYRDTRECFDVFDKIMEET